MLFEVIAVAQHDLVYFFVIILVIFLTFICTFQVAFGANYIAFSTGMKCFISLWTFTLRDHEKLDQVSSMDSSMGDICVIMYIFTMQFILMNMIRSFISHSYFTVASKQQNELTLDEKLAEKHWIVHLIEQKEPVEKQIKKLINENKTNRDKKAYKTKIAVYLSKQIESHIARKNKLENIQKSERKVWQQIKEIQKERYYMEQQVLNMRKMRKNQMQYGGADNRSSYVATRQTMQTRKTRQLASVLGEDVESPCSSLEKDVSKATREGIVNQTGFKYFDRPTLDSERRAQQQKEHQNHIQRHSERHKYHLKERGEDSDRGGPLAIEQINIDQKKTIEGLVNEKRTMYDEHHDSDTTDNEEEEEMNPHQKAELEEQERQLKEIMELQEAERDRYILERMDWDKNFRDSGDAGFEDNSTHKEPMMSELQEIQVEKIQLVRCGKILWRSIIFGFYVALIMVVCQLQLTTENNFKFNDSIDNYIQRLTYSQYATNVDQISYLNATTGEIHWKTGKRNKLHSVFSYETDSKKLRSVSINEIKNLNDTVTFMQDIVPKIGKSYEVKTAFDWKNFPTQMSTYQAYFMNERKYFIGDFIRLKFKINRRYPEFDEVLEYTKKQSTKIEFGQFKGNLFSDYLLADEVFDLYPNGTQIPADKMKEQIADTEIAKHSVKSTWYKSLIAIPAYFKNAVIGKNETEQCEAFLGRSSGYNYTNCDPVDRYYVFYINMTISDEIAQDLQQRYSINEKIDFRVMSYSQAFNRLFKDGFFTEKLQEIKIDFITYDRFYDLHGITLIDIKRTKYGEIYHTVRTNSIRLNQLSEFGDYISIVVYLVYYFLFVFIFYLFIIGLFERFNNYLRWEKFEIDYLTAREKQQRHQKKPELIRIYEAMFDNFTVINLTYFLLTLISMIKFIQIILRCKNIIPQPYYPIWPDLTADYIDTADLQRLENVKTFANQLEEMIAEFQSYKYYISLSVLFVNLKLFESFYQSQSMMKLINVITTIRHELLNFMVIFFCFVLGFLCLSFLSFGNYIQRFSSIEESFMTIFEISLMSPISYSFLDETRALDPTMTTIMFLPMSMIFTFIFTNIFLAIMMNSYELNIGKWRQQNQSNQNDDEGLFFLKSLLCCTIPKEGTGGEEDKPHGHQRKNDDEDDVLGIDQTPKIWKKPEKLSQYLKPSKDESNDQTWKSQLVVIAKRPDFMRVDFDPYDPNSKYNEENYLIGLDDIQIDMRMSAVPIKLWTSQVAKEIYSELTRRTNIRNKAKSLMDQKFQYLQMSRSQQKANTFDEFHYQQRRIEYWNYLREAIQLTNFQYKCLKEILKTKEKQIASLTKQFKQYQINTDRLYLKVNEIEKPIEAQLQKNMDLGLIVHCLEQEQQILNEKVSSEEYLYYYKRKQMDPEDSENQDEVNDMSSEMSDSPSIMNEGKRMAGSISSSKNNMSGQINLGGGLGNANMKFLKNNESQNNPRQSMAEVRDEFNQYYNQPYKPPFPRQTLQSQVAPAEPPVKQILEKLGPNSQPQQASSPDTAPQQQQPRQEIISKGMFDDNKSQRSSKSRQSRKSRKSRFDRDQIQEEAKENIQMAAIKDTDKEMYTTTDNDANDAQALMRNTVADSAKQSAASKRQRGTRQSRFGKD